MCRHPAVSNINFVEKKMKNNIGLQLLSLYKEISGKKANDKQKDLTYRNNNQDTSTPDGIVKAISYALERGDCETANTLLNDWAMIFPLENEDNTLYNFFRVETILREMDTEKDSGSYLNLLNNAINAANDFFFVNKEESNHAMDDEAYEIYCRITNITRSLTEDDEEAERQTINQLNAPDLLAKQTDRSPNALLNNAIRRHISRYGHLSSETKYLLNCIRTEFNIPQTAN